VTRYTMRSRGSQHLNPKVALNPSGLYAIKERFHGIKAVEAFMAP